MNRPFQGVFVAFAVLAIFLSLVGRADLAVAVPMAGAAVAASGLALWDALRGAPPATRIRAVAPPEVSLGSRVLFREGRAGREALVLLLDRLDRLGAHPDLPIRSASDLGRLLRLPPDEFRDHLAARLNELETAP